MDLELLTAAEFSRLRRCSLRTLDRERATGRGCPYVRLGARVLYRRADIERFIAAHLCDHGAGVDPARKPKTKNSSASRRSADPSLAENTA
jgi:hypothetical protein